MMEIFLKRFESFYDKYVEFYNHEEFKGKAFSELTNIQVGLNRINDKYIRQIEEEVDNIIESVIIDSLHDINDESKNFNPNEVDTTELKNSIMTLVSNPYYSSDWEVIHNAVRVKLLNIDFNFSELGKAKQDLNNALHKRDKLLNIIPNLRAIKFVVEKIAVDGYPESLMTFEELPVEKKNEISNVGRPLKPELPQSNVEDFIKKNLYENGQLTKNKRFIHATGKYTGKPNWNQLADQYLKSNPEIEEQDIISKRRLIERLKKAYDETNTSMK